MRESARRANELLVSKNNVIQYKRHCGTIARYFHPCIQISKEAILQIGDLGGLNNETSTSDTSENMAAAM